MHDDYTCRLVPAAYHSRFTHGDNGSGEYRSEQNISAFALMNATLTTCPPYTPAKNGAAERSWGIIIPGANCLMAGIPGSFPASFWCYAVNLSAHVANLTPVHSLGYKSPYEMLALATGKTIAIAAVPLHKFGAAVIMHLEPQNRDTGPLAKNAVEEVFLGISPVNLSYYVWRPDTKLVSVRIIPL